MENLRAGVIGLGGRGYGMVKAVLLDMPGIEITYICDLYQDRVDRAYELIKEKQGFAPKTTLDYREVIASPDTDVILTYSAWEAHVEIAIAAMNAGKFVGTEVGGAYTLQQCYDLVETYERTGVQCMMLENCCYGREELLTLNMVKQGIFGDIVFCSGGYHHDLRDEITGGDKNRHYRLRNYKARNCENYPTHELGPIAKVLDINRGNRMLGLHSMATKAVGLNDYAAKTEGVDPSLANFKFAQGDIVTTVIDCANGQNIVLTLDTSLPRIYSRGFTVRGTHGMYSEWDGEIIIDGQIDPKFEWSRLDDANNIKRYYEKYEHPIWQKFLNDGVRGGHGGMDWLVTEAFIEAARNSSSKPPIDTYDTASWMCITPLSEISIKNHGNYVEIPDFTSGRWKDRTDFTVGEFNID
ncbi:MAG: Gfo/Idh/MocA family oxidoreductase [Firmicutes bacterium]|nr:Gfo/Idh/MocA family oxidoreductase [Candidatus Colimorpha enterica]